MFSTTKQTNLTSGNHATENFNVNITVNGKVNETFWVASHQDHASYTLH